MLRLLPVAALASAVVATPALAEDGREVVQTNVSYSDLALSDPADVAKLSQRIDRKARQICAGGYNRDLRSRDDIESCRAIARESVEAQIDRAVQIALRQVKPRRS